MENKRIKFVMWVGCGIETAVVRKRTVTPTASTWWLIFVCMCVCSVCVCVCTFCVERLCVHDFSHLLMDSGSHIFCTLAGASAKIAQQQVS